VERAVGTVAGRISNCDLELARRSSTSLVLAQHWAAPPDFSVIDSFGSFRLESWLIDGRLLAFSGGHGTLESRD